MHDHAFMLFGVTLFHTQVFMACSGMKGKGKCHVDEIPRSLSETASLSRSSSSVWLVLIAEGTSSQYSMSSTAKRTHLNILISAV